MSCRIFLVKCNKIDVILCFTHGVCLHQYSEYVTLMWPDGVSYRHRGYMLEYREINWDEDVKPYTIFV